MSHPLVSLTNSQDPFTGIRALVLFAVLWVIYSAYGNPGFDDIIPDNVSQTAYWTLLTRPELIGSIGSSAPKAGLILGLGALNALSMHWAQLGWLFSVVLAGFAAANAFLLGKIAHQIAGAGIGLAVLALALGSGYLSTIYMLASSNLFFLPPVFGGLWLLGEGRERAGIGLLCIAVTVRPEAIMIIAAVIAIHTLYTRRWWQATQYSAFALVAIAVFMLFAVWVQGSLARAGAGAATGYPAFASLRTFEHLRATLSEVFTNRTVALLIVPALFALWKLPRARIHALFFAMPIFVLAVVASGILGMHLRYIATAEFMLFALGCCALSWFSMQPATQRFSQRELVGVAALSALAAVVIAYLTQSPSQALLVVTAPLLYGLTRFATRKQANSKLPRIVHLLFLTVLIVDNGASGMLMLKRLQAMHTTTHPAIADAKQFLANRQLPDNARVIAEDELLNYVIARQPQRLASALSLQAFNLLDEAQRIDALGKFDYLYFSKRDNYGWNYFFYFPREQWQADPFRRLILEAIQSRKSVRYGSVSMTPIEDSPTHFLVRIDKR